MIDNRTSAAVERYLSGSTFPVRDFIPICEKYLRMEEALEKIEKSVDPMTYCGTVASDAISFDPLSPQSDAL